MTRRRAGVAAIALAGWTAASVQALAQQATSTPSMESCALRSDTVPAERVAMLARGFNLTGWLDGKETRRPDPVALADLRRRGFTHIRLPVTAERLMEAFSAPADVRRDLAELDRAIDTLLEAGFAVSLDLHPGGRLNRMHAAEPSRAFALIDNLWRMLARRYAARPAERLYFEVLNEPSVTPEIWNAQGPRLVATIRQEAPRHTVVYGPANFQRIDALAEIAPLAQSNVVYAVHFYDPMVFTHQGLDWSDDPLRDLWGVPFPAALSDSKVARLLGDLHAIGRGAAAARLRDELSAPWTDARVEGAIAAAGAWSARHRRPVIINEFGVLAAKAPVADRLHWLHTVVRAAARHCLGWAHWDYADGFGFMRRAGAREIPDEAVVRALLKD
jgi:endoglucanase